MSDLSQNSAPTIYISLIRSHIFKGNEIALCMLVPFQFTQCLSKICHSSQEKDWTADIPLLSITAPSSRAP